MKANRFANVTSKNQNLVSVVCICYNHEKYIARAIDSFLSQNHPDFNIEIIVADDASTDKTNEIIAKYASKNKDVIRPILRNKNVGIQHNLFSALSEAKGEYIALCEGDDYWTDNDKLAKQIQYMQTNQKAAICFHSVEVVQESSGAKEVFPGPEYWNSRTIESLLKTNYIQTNSVVYRRLKEYKEPIEKMLPIDWYLHILHALNGPIGFIKTASPMSVYLRHEGSVWWRTESTEITFWEKNIALHLQMHQEVLKLVKGNQRYVSAAYVAINRNLSDFLRVMKLAKKHDCVRMVVRQFPELIENHLLSQVAASEKDSQKIRILERADESNRNELAVAKHEISHLKEQVALLESELKHPLRAIIRKIIKRFNKLRSQRKV